MGKVYNKTVDDAVPVTDPDDRPPVVKEFCMVAHIHFEAADIEAALRFLASYFQRVADGKDGEGDQPFTAGHLTVSKADRAHAPSPETGGRLN